MTHGSSLQAKSGSFCGRLPTASGSSPTPWDGSKGPSRWRVATPQALAQYIAEFYAGDPPAEARLGADLPPLQ